MQGGFLYVQPPRSFSVYERTPLEKTKERSHQQKHFPTFYGKQAVKLPSTWEFMNFWGIKAYNNGLVRWMVNDQKGWTVEGDYKIFSDLQYAN